ncbi:MAG: hypothetical protein H0S78_11830, partial [Tissierellales bacterium]|nr:hypothetical protein [Tissierellales bacterium]
MKNKILNKILVVLLLTILVIPGVAYGEEDYTIMPISIEYTHWADKYIDTLNLEYNTEEFFENKDLDDEISTEDLVFLIQNTLKDDFEYNQEEITREKAVYEFTKIWAQKTEQNLDEIATIKMIIYADTEKIDAEYNHAVTVSYMKGIAEGRGERIFDPKALLTYGEAAALVVKTEEAVEEEMKNQNPIVEGKFETRGYYEVTNDMVTFNFELFSHYEESKELMFSSGQQFADLMENAFIRFDVHEKTFRFHNIFRNYLEKNTFLKSKAKYIKYIKRIGKWYINNDDVITGIKYFLKIGEYDLVLKEFEKKRINIIFDNNKDFVMDTFKEIPEDFKNNHPIAHLAYIGFYTTNIDSKEGLNLLDTFENNLMIGESFDSKERKQIKGENELIKAYAEFNNPWEMRKSLKAANELL